MHSHIVACGFNFKAKLRVDYMCIIGHIKQHFNSNTFWSYFSFSGIFIYTANAAGISSSLKMLCIFFFISRTSLHVHSVLCVYPLTHYPHIQPKLSLGPAGALCSMAYMYTWPSYVNFHMWMSIFSIFAMSFIRSRLVSRANLKCKKTSAVCHV